MRVLGTGEVEEIVNAIGIRDRGSPSEARRCETRRRGLIPLLRADGQPLIPNVSSDLATLEPSTGPGPGSRIRSRPTYLYDADTPRLLATPRHYAYVKIAEGCDYKCAFCIIPTLRGHYRSRSTESIVAEARALAARGTKELLLISQDTSFYGVDRGERGALARLLRRLNDVDGLEWIRMLYLYPTTIGDDVLDAMAESEKVCNYIDLPLQHASDAVLKRMKRPGTRASYERLLDRIRRRLPGVALRTTFIVGFPGRDRGGFRRAAEFRRGDRASITSASSPTRTRKAPRLTRWTDDVPAASQAARQVALMSLQKRHRCRALTKPGSATACGSSWTGRRPSTNSSSARATGRVRRPISILSSTSPRRTRRSQRHRHARFRRRRSSELAPRATTWLPVHWRVPWPAA